MTRSVSFTFLHTGWLLIAVMLFQCAWVTNELGEAEALSESTEIIHNVGLHLTESISDTSTDDSLSDCDHCCQCSGHGSHITIFPTLPEWMQLNTRGIYLVFSGVPSHLNESIFRPPLS